MSLPLNKCLNDLTDYEALAPELAIVDYVGIGEQAPARRWEYAMALRALTQVEAERGTPASYLADVGGGGSTFHQMVRRPVVIDPKDGGSTLAQYIHGNPTLCDAVFCLSVLEHIPDADYDQFLYHLASLVAPGGLLFLTMDFWDQPTNTAHFHWMRERMFSPHSYMTLRALLGVYQCSVWGGVDTPYACPNYYSNQVYDYSFISLCMRKRP